MSERLTAEEAEIIREYCANAFYDTGDGRRCSIWYADQVCQAMPRVLAAREAAEARLSCATFFAFNRRKDDHSTYTVHIYHDDLSSLYGEEGVTWEVTVYEKGPDGTCLSVPFCVRVKTQDEAWAAYEGWAREALKGGEDDRD